MGLVVYSAQGQFAYNPAYQGISNSAYRFQTLGNAVSFISGLIAALLYGNIGVKVLYAAVFRDVFHLPPLDQKLGKIIWIGLGKPSTYPPLSHLCRVRLTVANLSSRLLGLCLDPGCCGASSIVSGQLCRCRVHPPVHLHFSPNPDDWL